MRFYDALQLDPAGLKARIRAAETTKERRRMQLALVVRALLLVLFCVVLITPVAPLFGAENNAMAVSLICILLSVRFVDFGYCIRDSLLNLGIVFMILAGAPALATLVHPVLAAFIHFGAIFLMISMTSDQPEMGNGGLYAFAYIFLAGNPVQGELLWKRCLLALIGYVLCAAIYYVKHRHKNTEVRYHHLTANFHLSDKKCQWQLQLALGVTLMLTLGSLLHVERLMWAGFACASLLGCYTSASTVKERFWQRIIGAVGGSLLFMVVYQLVPASFHALFGPIGGICLGFCTEYRHKTAINCFGALLLATGLYGLHGSVLLRVLNNLLGAAFGYGFMVLYQKLMDRHFEPAK